mgnify:CR=1 FL=1
MKTTVRAQEASRILNIPPQELRVGIQRGRFKFGDAIKNKGCSRLRYTVNLYKAAEELHIPLEEVKERWEELYEKRNSENR